jgi:hypothetical protein
MSEERIERLLDEANALKREAVEMQRESLALQREALAMQREVLAQTRGNLDRARHINDDAATLQRRARLAQLVFLPVVLFLIGYVSWLLFFKLGL